MKEVNENHSWEMCIVLCVGFLFGCTPGSEMDKKPVKTVCFLRFHNDNEFSYKSKDEFQFPIEESEIKKQKEYYKVYYNNDGNYYKADFVKNGKINEVYLFDSKGRVLESQKKDVVNKWSYGDNKKIMSVIKGSVPSEYELYKYEDDKLLKRERYGLTNVLLEYTVYDHSAWKYRTYDKNGKLIGEGEMVHIGK